MKDIKVIWLDDSRDPLGFINPCIYMSYEVIWVKNYKEFTEAYDKYKNDYNISMSLDHDLGEEENGYDCLKYVGEDCMNRGKKLPYIEIHSANPVGRENMESYINNFKKIRG